MVSGQGKRLRYAADEAPPPGVSVVVGLQTAVLTCVPVVVIMTIVARVAGQSDEYLLWTIFAGLVIGGLTTIVQAARFGGIGAGNLVIMGSCGAAIGVAVLALLACRAPLLATLGVPVVLMYLGFLNAKDMVGEKLFLSPEDWESTIKTHGESVVDNTCWNQWLNISGKPLLPLIRSSDLQFYP